MNKIKFGFDLDNTVINYDKAIEKWCSKNKIYIFKNVIELKLYISKLGNYQNRWLDIQEWLYTEGLAYATLQTGVKTIFDYLLLKNSHLYVISHKSSISAKKKLDLINPVWVWLNKELNQYFENSKIEIYFEETREKKINRITNLGITHFLDDLVEIFQNPNFPRQTKAFWFSSPASPITHSNVIQIQKFDELKKYV